MMSFLSTKRRGSTLARAAGALGLMLAFGGCSMDDVELNGSLFNAMGMGTKTKAAEPKLAARTGIVLPPDPNRLPTPGEQQAGADAALAALNDPDRKYEVDQAELKRQQDAYCDKNYRMAIAHGDRTTADLAEGPLGPCRGSIMGIVSVNGDKDAAE